MNKINLEFKDTDLSGTLFILDRKERNERVLKISDLRFMGLPYSLNTPFCLNCHKEIKDVPIRMWRELESGEVMEWTFCINCGEELGIFNIFNEE